MKETHFYAVDCEITALKTMGYTMIKKIGEKEYIARVTNTAQFNEALLKITCAEPVVTLGL